MGIAKAIKLTKPQKDALKRIKQFPVMADRGGVSSFERRKHPFRSGAVPYRQRINRCIIRQSPGGVHANVCGALMIPHKKTLIITYKSGRVEHIKFETPNQAAQNKEKLIKFSAIISVEQVA